MMERTVQETPSYFFKPNIVNIKHMKQQLLQSREVLIEHLEQKIKELRLQRNQLMNQEPSFPSQQIQTEHVNIKQYLNKQTGNKGKEAVKKYQVPIKSKAIDNNYIPVKTKADVLREQKETKERLESLKDLYEKKRALQSIGIYQNNFNKINGMYRDNKQRQKIEKKVVQTKKKMEQRQQKDAVIKEQLQKAQKFLKQTKQSRIKQTKVPENHYSKLILNLQQLREYDTLIKKGLLTLTDKEYLLEQTFEILKEQGALVSKQTLKIFLLSNPEFCSKFNITKTQIMRDLQVHPTESKGSFKYQEFYEMIKSIQITNKALCPNLHYKPKKQQSSKQKVSQKAQIDKDKQYQKEMESYLKSLFLYFDSKSQKIIDRAKFELALKKGLLFDNKKYKVILKKQLVQFGQALQKSKGNVKKMPHYKTLDLKYIGLQQIMNFYKEFKAKALNCGPEEPQVDIEEDELVEEKMSSQTEKQQYDQFLEEPLPNEALQQIDFEKYGWQDQGTGQENFRDLKTVDKYYRDMRNKYGNEISWNGIQRYRQDFSKFNACIKEMSKEHKH